MKWGQSLRGKWLRPLLSGVAKIGMSANHLTLLSLLDGLAFCPALLLGEPHPLVLAAAPPRPARRPGRAARALSGKGLDPGFPHRHHGRVVTATAIAMIHSGHAGIWPSGLCIFFYTVVVAFAFVRSAVETPYSWLFRPRFLVLIWYVVELYWLPGTLDWVLWASSGLPAVKCLTGFIRIRSRI
jgi:hypothetical protein